MIQYIKALYLCIKYHYNQRDKRGKRYFWHPIHVSRNVDGLQAKTVALLHDLIEDTPVTIYDLKNWGFDKKVVQAVEFLTNNKRLRYADYITDIKYCGNRLARIVKLADLKHNIDLSRIPNPSPAMIMKRNQYLKAIKTLEA